MAPRTTPATSAERLAHRLIDRASGDGLGEELASWLTASRRFRVFAEANADKIRKKLRTARDADSRLDVRAELLAAHLLLRDRRFALAFEPYGSGKRGPDFTVTFRDGVRFNLEVTRLRRPPGDGGQGGWMLAKLQQLPPSIPNALLVAIAGVRADALDADAAARGLRSLADRKDEPFFTRQGFDGTRDFYERFLRLGAVFVWSEASTGDGRATMWRNRSARTPVPEPAARACLACLRAHPD